MSLQYLLDGYNIIHKMPPAAELKLEDQRQYLIRFIETSRPHGSSRNNVTIVFDGQTDMGGMGVSGHIGVIFSQGRSADDKIKDLVEKSSNARSIVVVTDDRDIQFSVKANGAKVMAVKEFLGSGGKKPVKAGGKAKAGGGEVKAKHVPKSVESRITSELKEVWLRPGKEQKRKAK